MALQGRGGYTLNSTQMAVEPAEILIDGGSSCVIGARLC
jgi:hypothetical protein